MVAWQAETQTLTNRQTHTQHEEPAMWQGTLGNWEKQGACEISQTNDKGSKTEQNTQHKRLTK